MLKLRLSSLILIFSFMASPIMPESIRLIDTVSAQEEKKKKPKTRRSQVLSKAAFNQITAAQEALAESNHDTAMNILLNMMKSDRYNPYEKGVAQQTYAYVWADKGDLYSECERWCTRFSAGEGRGVVDRRVRYVAALYRIADGPGGSARQAGWQNG